MVCWNWLARLESLSWEVHRTEGTLGHSYSVFIPYMNTANKDQVNCGLKVEIAMEKAIVSANCL